MGLFYFGLPNFGDPSLQPRVPVPAGRFCCWCGELILPHDSGVITPGEGGPLPYHEACWIRSTLGSVGHQRRICPCFGGQQEDPQGLTPRQAAEAALDESYRQLTQVWLACLGCGHARRRHGEKVCLAIVGENQCRCTAFEENKS